jgi:SH3-like domain-containing protein
MTSGPFYQTMRSGQSIVPDSRSSPPAFAAASGGTDKDSASRPHWVRAALGLTVLAVTFAANAALGAGDLAVGAASGLPVPRFVSLKPDRVTVRGGPDRDHEIAFVFTRAGLPVEITAESDNWRRIRDWEGAEGWVYHSLLSGKRTALVSAKQPDELVPLYDKADIAGTLAARLQPGVLATVKHCTGIWCRISGAGFDGWVVQERLWGVYPNEKIE